jgi:hypothetical protein
MLGWNPLFQVEKIEKLALINRLMGQRTRARNADAQPWR